MRAPGVTLPMMDDTAPRPPRPLRRALRRVAVAAALVATLGTAAACSSDDGGLSATEALPSGQMLIDVRTPAEFAEGHLDGAVNLPVELPTFPDQVAMLDPDMEYLVYCRTGRRAGIAIDHMETLGLTASNLGSVEAASEATGVRIVG